MFQKAYKEVKNKMNHKFYLSS